MKIQVTRAFYNHFHTMAIKEFIKGNKKDLTLFNKNYILKKNKKGVKKA